MRLTRSVVAAASNTTHTQASIYSAVRVVAEHLGLPSLIKRGDKVLAKVNMGCAGARKPELRYTTHPAYVRAVIECLKDCGARVMFGDDVSRAGKHVQRVWRATGMLEVAEKTGASLVDFIAAGGREVRGSLLYPRTHFITNHIFESDVVVNVANCRSLSIVVMSGAVKNMFGSVLGTRKRNLHALFPDIRDFSRVIVDIFKVVRPRVSFLDLTNVIEAQSVDPKIQSVGLVLGSTDPVALDTVAAHAIGYQDLTVWTSIYGQQAGLGCNDMTQISIQGLEWNTFERKRLRYPAPPRQGHGSLYDRVTRFLNNGVLRPRPIIIAEKCTNCGECASRCPADAINPLTSFAVIDHARCADCGCCVKVCEHDAVESHFTGAAKLVRSVAQLVKAKPQKHSSA